MSGETVHDRADPRARQQRPFVLSWVKSAANGIVRDFVIVAYHNSCREHYLKFGSIF